jgi:hypothetical protein
MSSRQEEKERRRREREEREAAAKASSARRKRLQVVLGVVLAIVVVGVGGTFAVLALTGGDSNDETEAPAGSANIPAQKVGDLKEAAKLAGCTLQEGIENEGANHEEKDFKASDYKQNPPTSGNHFPQWYEDGIYGPGDTPELGKLVHTLEHGRIDIQYKPGTPKTTVAQLEKLYEEMDGGHHLLLFENGTGMSYAVAATAWDNSVGCPTMNAQVFDAFRAFRTEHIDKGPEIVP